MSVLVICLIHHVVDQSFWIVLILLFCPLIVQVPVPRFAVGIVIGRNGEMIKKIQNDTGVRIQFKPGEHLT